MSVGTREEELLKKLAAAISANPRSNTAALAKSSGISRATFNRVCGSRENLMEMIAKQAKLSMQKIISLAQQEVKDYSATLSALIEVHFENQEYLIFACEAQSNLENAYWERYINALDSFFLGGQKANVFCLELPSQTMTELFIAMICGMIDASQRGRVAALGVTNQLESFFLNGIVRN